MLSYMPELVGFQSMVILDPNGMNFDTVGAFGLAFQLLFNSDVGPLQKWFYPIDARVRFEFQAALPKMGEG